MRFQSSLGEIDMPDGVDNRSSDRAFGWQLARAKQLQTFQLRPSVVSEAAPRQLSVLSRPLTANIVSTAARIRDLEGFVSSLALFQAETSKANAEIHFYREEHHAHLELPRACDEFLANVGGHTRHNFCRYRRRSESAGNEFCPDLPFADFCAAAEQLFPKEAYARHESNFRQCL